MGGKQLNKPTLAVLEGGRVMDWDTVALLDGRPLDERTLAVCGFKDTVALLDGRKKAG